MICHNKHCWRCMQARKEYKKKTGKDLPAGFYSGEFATITITNLDVKGKLHVSGGHGGSR